MARKRRSLGWLVFALVVAAVVAYQLFGDHLRLQAGLPLDRPPARGGQLRIVSWNLHNFPSPDQDLDRLRERLIELDADVVAVQEIKDPQALRELVPEWELLISEHGGAGGQKVGLFYDPTRIELVGEPTEHRELTMKGRVRPAFHAYLRRRDVGPDFHVVVVHLKARPDGIELRRQQWQHLAALVRRLTTDGDSDLILLGDFNTTGPDGGATRDELRELERALSGTGLRRVEIADACTAYWDGARRDAWQEPSLLDLIWVRDLEESASAKAQAVALAHCAAHQCDAFRSTEAYPVLDYERVSDHCPLVVDLGAGQDDDR